MAARVKAITVGLAGIGVLTLMPLATWAGHLSWEEGQAQLERALPTGQSRDFYAKKLRDMGFQITSTNYSNDDYLEYEVVKGDQTYEVQVDFNTDTNRASAVDVARNVWQTEATERALAENKRLADEERVATSDRPVVPAARANRYSDRDRSRSDQMIKELEALPLGHTKDYYSDELKRHGYTVTKVNKNDQDELSLEAVKNGHSVEFNVAFDEDNGKSTSIDADTMWVESESTKRVRTGEMAAAPADKGERWQQGQAQLEMALPAGQPRDFYARKLKDLGYKITSTNEADRDKLEYEVVKGDRTYEVEIGLDEDTNRATKVDVQANLWKAENTERVAERNRER